MRCGKARTGPSQGQVAQFPGISCWLVFPQHLLQVVGLVLEMCFRVKYTRVGVCVHQPVFSDQVPQAGVALSRDPQGDGTDRPACPLGRPPTPEALGSG